MCKLKKSIAKSNNVGTEDIEKVLNEPVGAVRALGFLLKCLIILVVFFGRFS